MGTARRFLLSVVVICAISSGLSAPIATAIPLRSEECLECHEPLKSFQHGTTTCTSCHTDVTALPHEEKLRRPACITCHGPTVALYRKSVHENRKLECKECHATHFLGKDKKACITCHGNVAHKTLPSAKKHLAELSCVACHGSTEGGAFEVEVKTGAGKPITREMVDLNGNSRIEQSEWNHFEALLAQNPKKSYEIIRRYIVKADVHTISTRKVSCNKCHAGTALFRSGQLKVTGRSSFVIPIDPSIFVPELPSAEKFKATIHGKNGIQCIDCHVSQEKISDYACIGCHERVYGVYKNTIHAKNDATQCTDCHNPHAVEPYRELSSNQRLAICSRCHKNYIEKHNWLPNTVQHFEHLECSACHSPLSAKSMVFYFETKKDGQMVPLKHDDFVNLFDPKQSLRMVIDKNRDGSISSLELTDFFIALQRKFGENINISSSIIVTKVHHDYSERSSKEKICASCHSERAPFYSSMYLVLTGPKGTDYVPVKGTILSQLPISVFVDVCLLGQEKIKPEDIRKLIASKGEERYTYIREIGFKWIDLVGISLIILVLLGIGIHGLMRIIRR
jgi:predicted CXXCH cytochrome family protein